MGQGHGEDATPVLSPQWTRGGWPTQGAAADGNIEDDNNRLTVSDISDAPESPFDVDNNRTFLDTETLCSRSGSSSHHLHPRPLHHYQRRPVHADSRIHAQHAHAYAPAFANRHSRDRSEPQLQTGRRHPPAELDLSDTLTTDEDRDFGDKSFLISRPTSIATMAMTTSTTDVSPISSGLNHPWRVELRLPTEALPDDGQCPNIQQYQDLLSEIDSEFLFPDNVLAAVDNRPSSSRSHLLHWRRNRSSGSDSSNPRVSSDCQPPMDDSRPSTIITREEFEALPPTIQRKVSLLLSLFSLARLSFLFGVHSFRHPLIHRMGRERHADGMLILDASLDGPSHSCPFPSHLPINPESKAENHRNHGLG